MTRSDDTREKLFAAAVALIGERGFHGTTVDAIVERAGVAKGTVYYHFKGKTELFDALLADGLGRLADCFRDRAAQSGTPRETLAALVSTELEYIFANQSFFKLLMSEMWRMDRTWRESLQGLRGGYVVVVHDVLADGIASGDFIATLNPDYSASAVFGMVAVAALDWLVFDPSRTIDDVYADVSGLVMRAVGAQSA